MRQLFIFNGFYGKINMYSYKKRKILKIKNVSMEGL